MAITSFHQDIVSRQIQLNERLFNLRNEITQFRLIEGNAARNGVTNEEFAAIPAFDHISKGIRTPMNRHLDAS